LDRAGGGLPEIEMTRRTLVGQAIAFCGLPAARTRAQATKNDRLPHRNRLETERVRLRLRHTWTTVMSSSDYRDTIYCRFSAAGATGIGEGAPIVRYKEDAASAAKAIESVRGLVETADPWQFAKLMSEIFRRVQGENAGKAAIDIALMDWAGQKLGAPLYRHFGLDPNAAPVTTFSIGIDTPEITKQKTREAADYPVLKVKVGLDTDEQTIEAIRSVTKKPIRVDANEGWKDKEEAVRKINWLEKQGVEFVEQPMPAEMIEETRWVRARVHLPLIADEACQHASDIPKLAGAFDGINVKLDKAGGIQEAHRWIEMAKSLNLRTMLGCMISSSVSVTAAAHLSPLVDYADLDGNLLISNDPYRGVTVEKGKLILPNRPGLGLTRAKPVPVSLVEPVAYQFQLHSLPAYLKWMK
jgi:L-Ala-D/L-Glu epimerase